jgi:hypothetical protein
LTRLFDPGPGTFDHDVWVNAGTASREGILRLAEAHSLHPYFGLQILVRYSERSPLDSIERYADYLRVVAVSRSEREEGAGVVRVSDPDEGLDAYLACCPGSCPGAWLLCTSAKSGQPAFDSLLSRILGRLGAVIQSGWLSSQELEWPRPVKWCTNMTAGSSSFS